jgi:hypothetical protein
MAEAKKDYPLRQRRSLEEKAKNEPDPDWRRFFLEVGYKQGAAKKKEPKPAKLLKKFLTVESRKTGPNLAGDLEWLRGVWPKLVDAEVAGETDIFAFKNGTLTVVVYSSALLQEIRQFHKESIFQDLRDAWQGSMPLLKITYRIGTKR